MSIFEKETSLSENKYPHLKEYYKAIHEAFWTPDHFVYDKDVRDFNVNLNDTEREVVKRLMLAVAQVENAVKTMWAHLDSRMPNSNVADVCHTFAGNEVIHKITYANLLKLLSLEHEFEYLKDIPAIDGRSKYLKKYLEGVNSRSNKEFTKSLILFVLLIENCSLFSQFATLASFKRHKNLLVNFGNIVTATAKEEAIHGQFGAELIKIIRKENPDWFDDEMEDKIRRNVRKALKAELGVLDWIFEKGELDFLKKKDLEEYLKFRFNYSLNQLGYTPEFEVGDISKLKFFETQTKSSINFDFFDTKNTDYVKRNLVTPEDWD